MSALYTVSIQLFPIIIRFYSSVSAIEQALNTHHSLSKHLVGSYGVPAWQWAFVSVSWGSVTKCCREAGSLKSGIGRPTQLAGKTLMWTFCVDSKGLSIILMLSWVPRGGGEHQPYLQMSQLHLREGLLIFSTLYLHSRADPSAYPSPRWGQCLEASGSGAPHRQVLCACAIHPCFQKILEGLRQQGP